MIGMTIREGRGGSATRWRRQCLFPLYSRVTSYWHHDDMVCLNTHEYICISRYILSHHKWSNLHAPSAIVYYYHHHHHSNVILLSKVPPHSHYMYIYSFCGYISGPKAIPFDIYCTLNAWIAEEAC